MAIELAPHQLKAIEEMGNGKILCGLPGVGKSRTALAYCYLKELKGEIKTNGKGDFKPFKNPMDIYVITTARKRNSLDWESESVAFGISTDRELSVGGIKLTVDSWNNIGKYVGVEGAMFIFDEQRLVGSGAWVKHFYKIASRNRWILLSATPGDTWSDYIPVFVANGYFKNKSDFASRHVVYSRYTRYPKVDRYVGQKALLGLLKGILVDMPLVKHTVPHKNYIAVDYDKAQLSSVIKNRWNPYTNAPISEVSELFYTMRKVVNSHDSRVAAVVTLLKTHPKLIIFYNFDYELEILRGLASLNGLEVKEWNGHKHEEVPESESWVYLVQYMAGAEAWNCVTTDTIVFYSLNYSYRMLAQAEGRIDRMNTEFVDLYYYVLRSTSPIDLAILRALGNKKDFNERSFKL